MNELYNNDDVTMNEFSVVQLMTTFTSKVPIHLKFHFSFFLITQGIIN